MALFRLEKFDEKAEPENENQEEADQFSAGFEERGFKAEAPEQKEDGEVKDRLIKLHGVARHRSASVGRVAKNDPPGQIGWSSKDFLVDEVAQPNASAGEGCGDRYEIEKAHPSEAWSDRPNPVAKEDEG